MHVKDPAVSFAKRRRAIADNQAKFQIPTECVGALHQRHNHASRTMEASRLNFQIESQSKMNSPTATTEPRVFNSAFSSSAAEEEPTQTMRQFQSSFHSSRYVSNHRWKNGIAISTDNSRGKRPETCWIQTGSRAVQRRRNIAM